MPVFTSALLCTASTPPLVAHRAGCTTTHRTPDFHLWGGSVSLWPPFGPSSPRCCYHGVQSLLPQMPGTPSWLFREAHPRASPSLWHLQAASSGATGSPPHSRCLLFSIQLLQWLIFREMVKYRFLHHSYQQQNLVWSYNCVCYKRGMFVYIISWYCLNCENSLNSKIKNPINYFRKRTSLMIICGIPSFIKTDTL